jgi:hypothetical protein
MERQRRRLKPNFVRYDACRQPFWPLFDQQTENRQTMLVSESTKSINCFCRLHGSVRYYENYRNVNCGAASYSLPDVILRAVSDCCGCEKLETRALDLNTSAEGFCTTTVPRDFERAEVRESAAVYRLDGRHGLSLPAERLDRSSPNVAAARAASTITP